MHPSNLLVAGLVIVLAELGGAALVAGLVLATRTPASGARICAGFAAARQAAEMTTDIAAAIDAAHVGGHRLLSAELPMFGPRCHA